MGRSSRSHILFVRSNWLRGSTILTGDLSAGRTRSRVGIHQRHAVCRGRAVDVWEFHVGGYPVCHKWLKDRKGRALSYEDITHYRRVVAALAATITLMERIDEAIEAGGDWPIV